MKNLRSFTMPNRLMNPQLLLDQMKHAGFDFNNEVCPIKIKQPWDRVDNGDGTVTWRQWDEDGSA